ncbi:hypothetical protein [Hymenobacter aerophilus]|uniref:hypothetical protein n=1 Tax=Hymenobacter aerophilus TaxID=119644 RepID=UPI00037EDFFD|nr:hypothetical protein [Hymenobacter aerophilus]
MRVFCTALLLGSPQRVNLRQLRIAPLFQPLPCLLRPRSAAPWLGRAKHRIPAYITRLQNVMVVGQA